MRCPHCQANLAQANARGEPMLRNHGLVLRAEGVAAVCPKCKGDVQLGADLAKALRPTMVLIFNRPRRAAP